MHNISTKTHELKSWPEFFEQVISNQKTHELRRADDRVFNVGEHITLREFNRESEKYTGREVTAEITYITNTDSPCAYSKEALDSKFCILSIRLINEN